MKNMIMNTIKTLLLLGTCVAMLSSCTRGMNTHDATGCFEAEETLISAEANGVIRSFVIEEGAELAPGVLVGYIDSTQLYLRKKQLENQVKALLGRRPDIQLQLSTLESQLKTARTEKDRIEKLLQGDAATPKQLDDIKAQVEVLEQQLAATASSLKITSDGVTNDAGSLRIQIEQLNDQLSKCKIINPIQGTVLNKFVRENEFTAIGQPLYKIANLQEITLRAYVSSAQLTQLKLGQQVEVYADFGVKETRTYEGCVSWISSKSEFTPKTIQTQDERANLVYAVKIRVPNDGYLKIGMYAQVDFPATQE